MMKRFMVAILLNGLLFCSNAFAEFDQNSAVFTNTYLSIKQGERIIHVHPANAGKRDYKYRDAVTTEIIDGVSCLKMISIDTFNQWFSILWLAQDTTGNIYVLQVLETDRVMVQRELEKSTV